MPLVAALLPTRCAACGRAGPSPCGACAAEVLALGPPRLRAPSPLVSLHAAFAYEGPARDLVARVKHRNDRAALGWLVEQLAGAAPSGWGSDAPVVTWVPTAAVRARRRGFDHAALLAGGLARARGLRCAALLERTGSEAQTGRDRAARTSSPPSLRPRHDLAGRTVLLVDDVTTTGATLAAAGRALVAGGAGPVHGVVLAATPAG